MKSSRTSFERSGLKRPRLSQDISERASNSGFRPINNWESLQQEEIVTEYKRGLAELTINSKPIITNLTIIAGENLRDAKAIAAIICGNILEIPREQKLPSLYLLDSIVKNIGRDYIKYFAARLPEVFCKAYRQVEPSVHSGMQRLFVTWRKVFPPQQLQLIEKELGFTTGINGSSSGMRRDDSKAQQSAHSIHVNPKYLEKPEGAAIVGSGRSWVDISNKCVQKEQLNERIREKTTTPAYGDPEYVSDLSRVSGFGLRITGEKFKQEEFDKSWYYSVNGKILRQRNGLDLKHGVQSLPQKTSNSDAYPQLTHSFANRSSTLIDRSLQSSDEEEYMWDDADSAGKDQGASEDSYKSGVDNQHPRPQGIFGIKAESEASADSLSREDKGQASSENQMSSMWLDEARHLASGQSTPDHPRGYLTSFSGLSTATNSILGKSFQSQKGSTHVGTPSFGIAKTANGSRRAITQPRETQGAVPPSLESAMPQLPPSPSVSTSNFNQVVSSLTREYQTQTESHADPRMSQFSRRSKLDPRNQVSQDSLPMKSQNAHLVSSQISQTPQYNPSSLMTSPQEDHHVPFPQNIQQASPDSESSGKTSMSSLLAAVMQSGVLGSSSSVCIPLNSRDKGPLLSQDGSRPPPSVANVQSDTNASNPPNYSQRNEELPRQSPDPAPTLVGNASLQVPNVLNSASSPVATLLSSLVAKGLISASKEGSPTSTPPPTPPQTRFQIPPFSSLTCSSTNNEFSLSRPAAKILDALPQFTKEEREVAFKPGVIRESNPGAISELLDVVPHQCGLCGLRLKLQVQLDRHLEWHASRNLDGELLHSSRKWYLNSREWITGIGSLPQCSISAGPTGGSSKLSECSEVMVPADEGQCICFLCGQFFEDSYDEESGKWMFKGAVYMNNSSNESGIQNPIVHKNCISESSRI
ncbi:unnamed protein product [Withania somnifera]